MEDAEMDKVKEDIIDLKSDVKGLKSDVRRLQLNDSRQDNDIANLKATLQAIQDDTNWIRRRITGALITAVITAIVGGVVAVAIANIF